LIAAAQVLLCPRCSVRASSLPCEAAMIYDRQAKELAEAINQHWARLSRMGSTDREAALARLCHDMLRFGSAGFTTPFTLTPADMDDIIKRMMESPEPDDPGAPPKKGKGFPLGDPPRPGESTGD
jgi:hypothetical protein